MLQHLVLGSHELDFAVAQHHYEIDVGQRHWPVRHQDHDAAACPGRADRPVQGLVAVVVEIRVRLVEYNEERLLV